MWRPPAGDGSTSGSSKSPFNPFKITSTSNTSSVSSPFINRNAAASPSSSTSASSIPGNRTPAFLQTSRNQGNLGTVQDVFRTPLNPAPRAKVTVPATTGGASSITVATTPRQTPRNSTQSSTTTSVTTPSSRSMPIEPIDRTTIVALVEGRGLARGEIGMACMSSRTPSLILCQFNDTQSYMKVIAKLNIFRPYEILMSATSCDATNPTQLYSQITKEVTNMNVIPIQRRIFNEARGLEKLSSLVAESYASIIYTITNKYYCLAASHALIKYMELINSTIFSSKTLKIEFQGSDQSCMIDHVTGQHLELLQSNQMPGSSNSLLGILNTCKTPHGSRLLRMSILQPSCDTKLINNRLDCIETLSKDRELLFGLQDVLGRLPIDIEHVISSLIQIPKVDSARITEQRINYIIALKQILELVPTLTSLFENTDNDYFQSLRISLGLPQFDAMLENIKRIIQDEAQYQKGSVNMKRQRCFAVKADIDPILDIARKAYCDLIDDINNYVVELSQEVGISFRLGSNNQRGFFVQFFIPSRTGEIPQLPNTFLHVKKRGNMVTFTTQALISLDHRAQEVLKEIENISGIIISELITLIRSDIVILYKVSEAVGNLDFAQSLANYALTTPRCVRPEFSDSVTSIRMGRHPILDAITKDPSVPNNTFLSEEANFMLITGPNMSGKTTYIKHVATLQIMAQLGSFVPADAATFRITRNIMSRIGTGDNIEENSSSFSLEMTEMTYILQNITDDSVIIIDELGRATSIEEGAAISWAIAEKLLTKKAFILFATHHMLLTKLESLYINALNFTMETQEWKNENVEAEADATPLSSSKLEYTHVIKRGVTDVEYYGLKLAMNTCYPPQIISNAVSMSVALMRQRGIEFNVAQTEDMDLTRNKVLLATQLLLAANSLTGDESSEETENFRHYMQALQEEFQTTNT